MSKLDDVLRYARAEIGYSRWSDPERGTKYGRWYANMSGETWCAANGIPYCAMFVSWCMAGSVDWSVLPSYNCDQIKQRAREAGYIISDKHNAQTGDIVLYSWRINGRCDHVGIVEENNGSYLTTIEGNTSLGTAGSQGNGGYVARRARVWKYVDCIIRPPYEAEAQDEPQQQDEPRKKKRMEFITRPNEKDYLVYFDGTRVHKLVHPDEAEAVRMAYRNCYGEELPSFEMGTQVSPWFTRFMDAVNAPAPDDLGTLRDHN